MNSILLDTPLRASSSLQNPQEVLDKKITRKGRWYCGRLDRSFGPSLLGPGLSHCPISSARN